MFFFFLVLANDGQAMYVLRSADSHTVVVQAEIVSEMRLKLNKTFLPSIFPLLKTKKWRCSCLIYWFNFTLQPVSSARRRNGPDQQQNDSFPCESEEPWGEEESSSVYLFMLLLQVPLMLLHRYAAGIICVWQWAPEQNNEIYWKSEIIRVLEFPEEFDLVNWIVSSAAALHFPEAAAADSDQSSSCITRSEPRRGWPWSPKKFK